MITYGADAPNVFTIEAWKKDPCAAVYHDYKIIVINDGCEGLTIPFIIGSMTNWEFKQMQLDRDMTQQNLAATYTYSFNAAEGASYQLVSAGMDPQTGLVDSTAMPSWSDIAYMQKLVDDVWARIPGEEGDNQLTHGDAEIVWDLRAEDLRWARCAPAEPAEHTVMWINFPTENAPEAIEIIGTFDDWAGTAMEKLETGWFFVELEAKASQYFKFRSAGSWDTELEVYNTENDEWAKIGDNQLVFGQLWHDTSYHGTPCKSIGDNDELDLSDPEKYRWSVAEQGIENVVLTEKAHKVVVDGVLYIVRDNKMFNIQGTQVR